MRSFSTFIVAMILAACGGGGGGGTPANNTGSISTSDPNAVMSGIGVKIGDARGILSTGNLPPASTASSAPKITSARNLSSSNGSTAPLSISLDANNPVSTLFLKVLGASSIFTVDVSAISTSTKMQEQATSKNAGGSKIEQNASFNFDLTLPSNLESGSFDVEIRCEDSEGLISTGTVSTINVALVGTGEVQFSLQWDSEVDLDLHVVEPSGEEIDFTNRTSATGGQLDFDDTDGTGPSRVNPDAPNAVENIFWETNAPRGEYVVSVDYFSGSVPTNFVVTITQAGQVVDTVSRNNFQFDDIVVYRLQN